MKFIECRSWDGKSEYGFLNIEEIVTIVKNENYCTVYYRNKIITIILTCGLMRIL